MASKWCCPYCGKKTIFSDYEVNRVIALYARSPRSSHFMADFDCPECGRGIDGQLLAMGKYTILRDRSRVAAAVGYLVPLAVIRGLIYGFFFRG